MVFKVIFVVIQKMLYYKWMIVDWCVLYVVKCQEYIRIESDWFISKLECLKDCKEKMKGGYDIVDCWVLNDFGNF